MARSGLAVLLLAPVMVLAACSGGDKSGDLPTSAPSTQSSSSTPSVSQSATPTPTSVPTRAVAKYGDLTVDLRRPASVGKAAEPAVGRFLELSKYFGQMASGRKTPAALTSIADQPAITYLNAVLQAQRAAHERSGGTMIITVTKARAGSAVAVVDACMDQRKLVTIRSNGTQYVDATVKRSPTLTLQATVSNAATGLWRVGAFSLKEAKC